MRRQLATIALAALAAGCSTIGTTTVTRVPVAVPCKVEIVVRPVLPVNNLTSEATVFEAARALWSSLTMLESYADIAEAAMQACR